jgi:tetratricopeptide (TPR) repeat protein
MRRKFVAVVTVSVLALSTLRAQDAKIVADNIEFSRDFYSGVHFSAIAESKPSFGYQRYPDNGPERIQCDAGTFARQHSKPWLKSENWGETGRPVDKQTTQKLDGWVKLVEAVFDFAPSEVTLLSKSKADHEVQWIFQARGVNEKAAPVRLTFARPLYDKNPNVLLHDLEGALPIAGGKTHRSERVKFSFGYLIAQGGYELSEALWENLQTPKDLENKPVDLTKIDMGAKPNDAEGFLNRAGARGFNGDRNGAIADLSRAIDLDPKSVPAVYRRGAFKLQKGDYDGAITDLSRAIELSPNTADYYSDRGLAKLRKRDNDGAVVDFTRAIELDPKNAIAYRNRALAKNINGDADGALGDYNRAIDLDPKSASAFNSRGMIKKSKGDLDGAIADFTKAIELNDKLAIAYKNRSEAKQAKGDAAGATEDLKRAGELDPQLRGEASSADHIDRGIAKGTEKQSPGSAKTVEDFFSRAIAKKAAGDLDGAIADYDRAIQLDPKDAAIYNNRGVAKQAKGGLDAAIVDFNRAIQLNPKDAGAYINRGNAKRDKGDLDGAMVDYNRAIRLDSKYAIAYYSRGLAKKQKNDLDGAIADYNRVIELDPKFAKAYCDRGVAKRRKGDLDGAISDYNRTVELDPKYAIAYFNRGNAKNEKGDLDGAIADYNRGIELNPKYADAYNNRGAVKGTKGDVDGAIADYNHAIELNPKNADAYYGRGLAKKHKSDLDGAIADYNRAIELDPTYALAYSNRADVYATKKDYGAAVNDIRRAIEFEPKNGDYYLSLGWYQLFNRKPREAIAASLKALQLSPNDAVVIKTNLAHGYLFDNQFDKAKTIYLENKDAKLHDDERTFSQAALDDFKEFQDAGITHPNMEKIKALLTTKTEGR